MMDDDLRAIMGQRPDRTLSHLEADIWAGVRKAELTRRTGRVIASCQLVVLVAALIGSAVAGAASVAATSPETGDIGHAGADLAPSTLLLGLKP